MGMKATRDLFLPCDNNAQMSDRASSAVALLDG
jgi:hypothetical protein